MGITVKMRKLAGIWVVTFGFKGHELKTNNPNEPSLFPKIKNLKAYIYIYLHIIDVKVEQQIPSSRQPGTANKRLILS